MNIGALSIILLPFFDFSLCCHSFGNQQQYYPRVRARGVTSMDRFDRNAIDLDYSTDLSCDTHPPYSSNDLRGIATILPFSDSPQLAVTEGGKVTCSFDDEMEYCSWHNVQENIIKFWKANFDKNFDFDRFDCTNIRRFKLDGNFLLAGGEPSISPQKVSIETEIPCQYGDGVVKFDFWANSGNPIVRFCILQRNGDEVNCEDILPMPNPVNFSIPTTAEPVRIRIEVVNLESDDIVLIDNIYYTGQICEIVDDDDITSTPSITTEPVPLLSATVSTKPMLITGTPETTTSDQNVQKFFEEEPSETASLQPIKPSIFGIRNSVISTTALSTEFDGIAPSSSLQFNELSACDSLSCNFNDGDSCFYNLNGIGGTSTWLQSDKLVGNRHTGIQRLNVKDQEKVGFAYAGNDYESAENDILVMESPKFSATEDFVLVFDVYLRSIHPRLKVCIDDFDDCPYSLPKLDRSQFWHFSQKVPLKIGSRKVFFVAENIRKHQFIAIDNVHLEKQDGSSYCQGNDSGLRYYRSGKM